MYKSVQRISILKRANSAKAFLSPNPFYRVQCARNESGLEKKEHKMMAYLAEIEPFTDFLHLRQEQAKRSVVVKIPDFSLWENLIGFCNKHAAINKVYHYSTNYENFVLIEMESEKHYQSFLNAIQKNQSFDVHCHLFKLTSSFKTGHSLIPNSISDRISLRVPLDCGRDLNMSKLSKTDSLSELIQKLYNLMKISDLGIRLRFLTCRQIELIFNGIVSNAVIYPFGSSVSGLGLNGCDLDMVVTYNKEDQNPFCMTSTTSLMDANDKQNKLETVFKVMKNFRNDMTNLVYVRNARVPIIKFKNKFTKVECDLSMENTLPVIASQILYTLSSLDDNIRPLIFVIKMWAKKSNVIVQYPFKTFSSFCITMLTVFFLQQNTSHVCLIPPWSILPKNYSDSHILNEEEMCFNLINFKNLGKTNDINLETLLMSFFKYYSTFNFQNHGISVKKGTIIANPSENPIFVENPLETDKNIGQNVTFKEVEHFQKVCSKAVTTLSQKIDNKTKLNNLLK